MKHVLVACCLASSLFTFSQGPQNLGPKINTPEGTECYPQITPDGQTLFFSRDADDEPGGYEIFYSTKDENGAWQEAVPFESLNNKYKNVVYHASTDGSSLVVLGSYGDEPSTKGFSVIYKTEEGWSEPEVIHFKREEEIKWGNNSCTISSNGNVMIVSLNQDLHVSWRNEMGIWTFPTKLPDNVNSEGREYTPFLASDDKTLYFSSSGHDGLGGNDIFKITRLDDSWLTWSNPENLGNTINSSGFESFFKLNAEGNKALVYSLSEGDGDLFEVDVPKEHRPEPVSLVKGVITNKKSEPLNNVRISYGYKGYDPLGTAMTIPQTGSFSFILKTIGTYQLVISADGYKPSIIDVNIEEVDNYREIDLSKVVLKKEK